MHMVTASFEEGVRWYGAPFQVVGLAGPEAIIVVVLGSTRRGSQVLYSSREANNVDISCFWTAFRERDLPKIAGWQSVLPVEHDPASSKVLSMVCGLVQYYCERPVLYSTNHFPGLTFRSYCKSLNNVYCRISCSGDGFHSTKY